MPSLADLYRALNTERYPWSSEQAYFASAPNVAGMMTQDQRVILRPELQGDSRDSVKLNELMRLRLQGYMPVSKLTKPQVEMFKETPYAADATNALRSIFARKISGDPSASLDFSQDAEIRKMRQLGGLLGDY